MAQVASRPLCRTQRRTSSTISTIVSNASKCIACSWRSAARRSVTMMVGPYRSMSAAAARNASATFGQSLSSVSSTTTASFRRRNTRSIRALRLGELPAALSNMSANNVAISAGTGDAHCSRRSSRSASIMTAISFESSRSLPACSCACLSFTSSDRDRASIGRAREIAAASASTISSTASAPSRGRFRPTARFVTGGDTTRNALCGEAATPGDRRRRVLLGDTLGVVVAAVRLGGMCDDERLLRLK